jgi:hypothetical protein
MTLNPVRVLVRGKNLSGANVFASFGEKGALTAQALVFTMDGVPMFYNE